MNISFTSLEEGQIKVCSAFANDSIAILRVFIKHKELKAELQDIIAEAKKIWRRLPSKTKSIRFSPFLAEMFVAAVVE